MRGHLSVAVAAAIAVASAVFSVAPAQAAATRAAPAVVVDEAASGVQLVHERRYRGGGRHYRRYGHRRNSHRYYSGRRYYQPHAYYGYPRHYGRPGVSLQFSFGGGGYHGYGY